MRWMTMTGEMKIRSQVRHQWIRPKEEKEFKEEMSGERDKF
jgi:hypothetical protein